MIKDTRKSLAGETIQIERLDSNLVTLANGRKLLFTTIPVVKRITTEHLLAAPTEILEMISEIASQPSDLYVDVIESVSPNVSEKYGSLFAVDRVKATYLGELQPLEDYKELISTSASLPAQGYWQGEGELHRKLILSEEFYKEVKTYKLYALTPPTNLGEEFENGIVTSISSSTPGRVNGEYVYTIEISTISIDTFKIN